VADLDDADLWRAVEHTVGDVLLPALGDDQPWARAVAVQLVGLARYAGSRPTDQTAQRIAELAGVLDSLAGNELVEAAWHGDRSERGVHAATGAVLAAAVGRDDAAAAEIRSVLRAVVIRQLDDELGVTSALVDAFRGRLDG
jgi:hypothetical protein